MASDYLLELDGIKGESLDEKHKDKIEIDSFSWGVSNSGNMGRGSGGGTGKADFQDLIFTKQTDKSSPLLVKAAASGDHIKKAVLIARKAGGKAGQVEYFKITLEDVMVSSFTTGGNAGSSSIPVDSFSLNYTKMKYEYLPQKADGSLEGAIVAQYDRAINKAT
jgi:type VI secretion system secreted protein Hcp